MGGRSRVRDVIVIGGGPGGAVSARELARRGLDVLLLERAAFPRFHIGESFLPRGHAQLRDLGLVPRLAALPRVRKLGAEFLLGHGEQPASDFFFRDALGDSESEAFNLERAPFDAMLLDAAAEAGVEVRHEPVGSVTRLRDGDVAVEAAGAEHNARYLVDASGQATVLGRHLDIRRVDPGMRKVAYFGHYRGVRRRGGDFAGFPTVVMCREGWFWLIPIDAERTSVGLVMDREAAARAGVRPDRMLAWGLRACPVMAGHCAGAEGPQRNGVAADFSYRCRPYAGPGYFLVGDAAVFVDPIFSTGVCLAMMAGEHLAGRLAAVVRDGADPAATRRGYVRYVEGSSSALFRLARHYYDHAFRELFLHGYGPLAVHRAVIALLAGNVFPRPAVALRWRLRLLGLLVALQRRVALVPRRREFSLLVAGSAVPRGARSAAVVNPAR